MSPSGHDQHFPLLPPVPRPDELVLDDPAWTFPSVCAGGGGMALLRVWRTADGHLAIVTESGVGVSITNSAEEITAKLRAQFPGRLTVMEHWRTGDGADHERLDQVIVTGRRTRWRPVWPIPPTNPDYAVHEAWMRAYGDALLVARDG
ncbi:hypothetical protein [Streptomyces nanshensis]|uniref:Uncharacterized protein n=1 Tax=Streptomyces nanshensis TaxID=518642 RepID=A0A1E7KZ71_9ACTN|nr:hypothetical protein [Streptomyces nanshensis]OEV09248.1 hypothetical protein AN218_22555 [Streptomyces nanshensis]